VRTSYTFHIVRFDLGYRYLSSGVGVSSVLIWGLDYTSANVCQRCFNEPTGSFEVEFICLYPWRRSYIHGWDIILYRPNSNSYIVFPLSY